MPTIEGMPKSARLLTTCRMNALSAAGATSGKVTEDSTRSGAAPLMRAASSSSDDTRSSATEIIRYATG